MKTILLAAAVSLAAMGGASAQMAPAPAAPAPMAAPMAPMMGGNMQTSCVSGGQFVACPPAGGMQAGMGTDDKMAMRKPMKRKMAMKMRKKKMM